MSGRQAFTTHGVFLAESLTTMSVKSAKKNNNAIKKGMMTAHQLPKIILGVVQCVGVSIP